MPERDLALRSRKRFLERDLHIVTQIAAALRPVGAAGGTPTRALLSEEHVEDIAETLGGEAAEAAALIAGMAEAIVVRALLRIGEHFVGFVDLFEVRFG